jgi:CheY-like chemotaxis protein
LGYRVQVLSEPDQLIELAAKETPLLLIADLESRSPQVCQAIRRLKESSATSHIPVIAILRANDPDGEEAARLAGANLVVTDAAILAHLKQFLDQALHVD